MVGGCDPDVMGMGPSVAVPKLLVRHGLTTNDIDLWELNEVRCGMTVAGTVLYEESKENCDENVCGNSCSKQLYQSYCRHTSYSMLFLLLTFGLYLTITTSPITHLLNSSILGLPSTCYI